MLFPNEILEGNQGQRVAVCWSQMQKPPVSICSFMASPKGGKWLPPENGWIETWGLDAPQPESAGAKEVPSNGKSEEEVARFTVRQSA